MATRDSGGVGIDHLTVVPEKPAVEPEPDEEDGKADAEDAETE